MNLSKFRFTLDLHSIQSQASIPVMVGDTSVTLIITITDGGLPYHIEDGCLAKISIKRPTGTYLEEFCIVKNNAVVEYAFSQNENTCAVPGVHVCDIVLYGADGGVVGTPRFTMVVSERVIRFDDIVLTDEDFTAVDAMVKQEVTRQAQEATRQSQEATRQEQERLRVIAENSREEAEAARTDDYKKAVQAAADAKAEADRAKKYVENFDAGLYTEKDPTVPAWAKKPNPPTAGDVGARPDTWMPTLTDIGAAPAGFGLGGNSKFVSDWNSCVANGWYAGDGTTLNGPDKINGSRWGSVFVHVRYATVYQMFIVTAPNFAESKLIAWRDNEGGTWSDWEYENPPMQLGVEYRTTERWQGKPVYTKLTDLGNLPATSEKVVYFTSNSTSITVVGLDVYAYDRTSETIYIGLQKFPMFDAQTGSLTANISAQCRRSNDASNLRIKTYADLSRFTAVAVIKYTIG